MSNIIPKEKFNQFSPSEEEVKKIIEQNKTLSKLERTCYKCGHKPCPCCGDWCDNLLRHPDQGGNWTDVFDHDEPFEDDEFPVTCCDMNCSYL